MRIATSLFTVVSLAGCVGKAPPNVAPDAPPEVDATVVPTGTTLTGKAIDYFGNIPVDGAAIETDGLVPAQMATSATDGAYQLEIAVGSKIFLLASKALYRPTRGMAVTVNEMPVTEDAYVVSIQDVNNQYTGAGATPTAGTAIVIADLRREASNEPIEGIPLANIQLLDAANQPVAGVKGPYVFNAAGAVDTTITTVTAFGGRSRIAYLDVPPGTSTMLVTYPVIGGGSNMTNTTSITTTADGATLALSGGGTGGGVTPANPTFAARIYLKLQRAGVGGLGCANCHTLSGPAAVLKYDDPPATVLANMMARPGVINLATPADSLLLVRPLYEQPPTAQDHPNATFLDVNDSDYKLFLLWITNGAPP